MGRILLYRKLMLWDKGNAKNPYQAFLKGFSRATLRRRNTRYVFSLGVPYPQIAPCSQLIQ